MKYILVIFLTCHLPLVFNEDLFDTNSIQAKEEEEALKLPVFDSYYHLTQLENYPDVCIEYSDENCARKWYDEINEIVSRNDNRISNVDYKYSTDINQRNILLKKQLQIKAAKLSESLTLKIKKFKWKTFQSPELRRIFGKLTASIQSEDQSTVKKIINIENRITYIYNKGKPCFKRCLKPGETEIIDVFKNERNYDTLAGFWTAWRNVTGAKIRNLFIDKMRLENIGARENGYTDAASFVLFNDFEDNNFKETLMKLYEDILPLYKELHAYVRHCLAKYYPGRFDKNGSIPEHIFGNLWAQKWNNIYPIIKQCSGNFKSNNYRQETDETISKLSVEQMFKMAEEFYVSIGMYSMTEEFWERSVIKQPPGKLMDCHGSAHDFSNGVDFRIMMCTKTNLEDFTTIHHEMGHIQYFMAYRDLTSVFRGSANSGFHEAIGDTIALAVKSPEHLKKIGLISDVPSSNEFDINYLIVTALEKIAFLPFAIMMDSFIWGVYNGSVPVSKLNEYWWSLKQRFQGIKPPVNRSENDFDAGAKYHIAFGVPYIRYFVSFLVQFQFYESMCHISGYEGPLHRCDFYQSKEAGSQMLKMLKEGRSKPWKETIEILTGTNQIKAQSLLKFFEPLYKWLKVENKKLNNPVGW